MEPVCASCGCPDTIADKGWEWPGLTWHYDEQICMECYCMWEMAAYRFLRAHSVQ